MSNIIQLKKRIIDAGHKAVEQLIKVAYEPIPTGDPENELAADKMKNAAAAKKLAIFDAFEILARVEAETEAIKSIEDGVETTSKQGFAERRSRNKAT